MFIIYKRFTIKKRILIVDDDPRWVEFACRDLEKFEIFVARNYAEASSELASERFVLVIASAERMDVLKLISEKYFNQKVVVPTTQPSSKEANNAYRLGAVRYFPKSFSRKSLFQRVEEAITAPKSESRQLNAAAV